MRANGSATSNWPPNLLRLAKRSNLRRPGQAASTRLPCLLRFARHEVVVDLCCRSVGLLASQPASCYCPFAGSSGCALLAANSPGQIESSQRDGRWKRNNQPMKSDLTLRGIDFGGQLGTNAISSTDRMIIPTRPARPLASWTLSLVRSLARLGAGSIHH